MFKREIDRKIEREDSVAHPGPFPAYHSPLKGNGSSSFFYSLSGSIPRSSPFHTGEDFTKGALPTVAGQGEVGKRKTEPRSSSTMGINAPGRSKKSPSTAPLIPIRFILLFLALLGLSAVICLHFRQYAACPEASPGRTRSQFSGDLRLAQFSWNHLQFSEQVPPPEFLRIAVFSRKWPAATVPGGMERHALTLYSALARRGHRIHVFTSPLAAAPAAGDLAGASPKLHFVGDTPSQWRPSEAWVLFQKENEAEPFDVVHSESVALPHPLAKTLPNLAVTWHGIAMEGLQALLFQAIVEQPLSTSLNFSLHAQPLKVVREIDFFQDYAHHVPISDAAGEMLRDVYQIPAARVHVILNGIDEQYFNPDRSLGTAFRREIGVLGNATLVLGVAGRLVRDKGHSLLHRAFSDLVKSHPGVYLLVAGTGPWAARYKELGDRVMVLGALPPAKLKAFYNSLDVFVNPTLRPQGLDLTLMEAMQCGKPIWATRFPSIKGSLGVEEEFGLLFAPNAEGLREALETAVEEGPARLAERGRACRSYAAAMFTARKMAAAYERLFLCIKKESYCTYPLPFDELL